MTGGLFPLDTALRGIRERFADAVIDADRTSLREHVVVVPPDRLAEVAAALTEEWQAHLLTMFALDEREPHGRFRLHAMFSMAPEDAVVTLVAVVPAHTPRYPAVSARVPAAGWLERELRDLLGVEPEGHPDPRPLVAHDGWPSDMHPLRRDFSPPVEMDWAPRFRVPEVEGEGVFAIPVGPIHAGLVEPAHFRFASAGESVLQLDVKLGWTWRGLEKLAEGGTLQRGLEIAERLCGGCSFAHALAWCGAVEELAGLTVPPRARGIRTIAAELERIANHLADLAGITDHVACPLAAMEYTRAQEVVRQTADALFGQRFLRGLCVPGGVTLDLDDTQQQWLRQVVADLRARTTLTTRDALATGSVVERLQGAGRLDPAAVQAWGATGPVARASGATRDARRDHPYAFYRELDFEVARGETGDARARLDVRVAEIHESLNLIDQLLLRLPGGPTAQHLGAPPADRWGCGLVESPRGLLTHWLRLDPEGRVADWRVRSASHALWPALAHAATGDLVPDFPLVNRSFGLCHGCTDK